MSFILIVCTASGAFADDAQVSVENNNVGQGNSLPAHHQSLDPALVDRNITGDNPTFPRVDSKYHRLLSEKKILSTEALRNMIQEGEISPDQAWQYSLKHHLSTKYNKAFDQYRDYQKEYGESIEKRQYLSGDWGGSRIRLAEKGLTFDASYTGEAAHNLAGGIEHMTRHASQLQFSIGADLEKLLKWKRSTFQLTLTNYQGRNLTSSANLNLLQQVQEVYNGDSYWQLSQLWINTKSKSEKWQFKYGRMGLGEDFSNTNCDFQNSTFCGPLPNNIVGDYWLTWPVSLWAIRAHYAPKKSSYFETGIYDVSSGSLSSSYQHMGGWRLSPPAKTDGMLIPFEYGKSLKIKRMPGTYAIGGWYSNAYGKDLFYNQQGQPLAIFGGDPIQRTRHGAYFNVQQQLTGSNPKVGWNLLLSGVIANASTASTNYTGTLGLEYFGPFNRKHDSFGIGTGFTHVNQRQVSYTLLYNQMYPESALPLYMGSEWIGEVFYSWAPVRAINIRPNIQYIKPAYASSPTGNIWVGGLKYIVQF